MSDLQTSLSRDYAIVGAETGTASLSAVNAARLTPDGRYVVILDRVPPFARIFSRSGELVAAGVQRGDGPEELNAPRAVAVRDDRAIIVDGVAAMQIALPNASGPIKSRPSVPIIDVGYDCEDRFVGYGVQTRGADRFYLHTLGIDSTVEVAGSYHSDATPHYMVLGYGHSIVMGSVEGSVVAPKVRGGVMPVFFDCTHTVIDRAWSWALAHFPSQRGLADDTDMEQGDGEALSLDPVTSIQAGTGELRPNTLLWLETHAVARKAGAVDLEDFEQRTYFYVVDSTAVMGGYIEGWYRLQDIRAGTVLLSRLEPWPQVILMPVPELEKHVRAGGIALRAPSR